MATREEKNKFSMFIIEKAKQGKATYIDAITTYCDDNNLEIEIAANLVNSTLKDLIETEAQKLRYLPRGNTLPL